jgi:hypothetical protein
VARNSYERDRRDGKHYKGRIIASVLQRTRILDSICAKEERPILVEFLIELCG